MATMKAGDRVFHQNSKESFGFGRIKKIKTTTALVKWETYRVTRERDDKGSDETDVRISSLKRV